jgi:hypothetical protein
MEGMVTPPEIEKSRLAGEPRLLWNTFAKFISRANTVELDNVQMAAQLPYLYDLDVCKSGHWHYFDNKYQKLGDSLNVLLMATLDALKIVGAHSQAEILARASDLYFCQPRRLGGKYDLLEQVERKNEFKEFDKQYLQALPGVSTVLESYLMGHLDHFVILV